MKKLIGVLLLLMVATQASAIETKFALVCEWKTANAGGSTTYYVDTVAKTVDGRKAVITENTIIINNGESEHRIDRTSGVRTFRMKTSKLYYPADEDRALVRCSKTSTKRF